MKGRIEMKLKILMMAIIILTAFNPAKLLFESNIPDVYQQEQVLASEEKNLKITGFEEKRREFVRQQTYLVYYILKDDTDVDWLKMMLREKFLENGWKYKNEFVVYDTYLKMNKLNINYTKNDYYCTVVINLNGMALRLRYKNYYQK